MAKATPKSKVRGTIVPAKVVYPKRKKGSKKGLPPVGASDCCALLCPTPGQPGMVVCTTNGLGVIVAPQAGGPWAPAYNTATGAWVYVNVGGLS